MARDIIVSEAQTAADNRSIVNARDASHALGDKSEVNMGKYAGTFKMRNLVFCNPSRLSVFRQATVAATPTERES